MQIISIVNKRGGVAKTTTALALVSGLFNVSSSPCLRGWEIFSCVIFVNSYIVALASFIHAL